MGARERLRWARWSLLAGVLVFLALSAPVAAHAHPSGPKPVALITGEGERLNLVWIVALDDFAVLADSLNLPLMSPQEVADHPDFRSYFEQRVSVANDTEPCGGSVEEITPTRGWMGIHIGYRCGGPLQTVEVRIELLHDLSPDYITLAEARVPSGRVRRALRPGAESMVIDFGSMATAPGEDGPEAVTGAAEGRLGRILAAVEGERSFLSVFLALALALFLGALHGVTPGHGKTITAAYLVGEGGSFQQAFALGGVVTLTHTFSVVVLVGVALSLNQLFVPTEWEAGLQVAAGVLILGMGVSLVRGVELPHHHHHPHSAPRMPLGRLALLGLVGGLIPSPEAVAIVLVAFSLERWTMGVLLVAAFSLGLAAVVLAVALAALRGGRILRRLIDSRWIAQAPRIAGVVFLAMGSVVTFMGLSRF